MAGKGKILTRFALVAALACFMYPSLLYKSISRKTRKTDLVLKRSAREARSMELELDGTVTSAPPRNNCVKPSIDEFPNDFMTQYQRREQGGVVIHFLLAIYMFGALAVVCDDYFVPSLEQITKKLNMDSDVAGATFMAAGSSAPELFTSVIGVFITESDIGLGTIVGSAVFNILFIVAICGLFAGSVLRLKPWPLLRDCTCYLLSIAALIAISYDKKVYWYEAVVLVTMYLLYVVIMYFNTSLEGCFARLTYPGSQRIFSRETDIEGRGRGSDEEQSLKRDDDADEEDRSNPSSAADEVKIIDQSDESPFSMPEGLVTRVLWILALPVACLFYVTIPNCRSDKWEKWYLVSFFVSVVWIALLSYVLVWMVTIIGFTLGIPDVIMGLTFLAAGSSVPDGISSLIVARQGDGDMAVSNTVGSNVFDILLCLGLPWLLKTTAVDLGGYVVVLSGSIIYTSISLFGTVFVTIFLVMVSKWYLNRLIGMAFLIIYLIFITIATLFELNVIGEYNLPTCKT